MSKLIPDTDELLDRCDCGARAGFLIDDDKVCGAECTDKYGSKFWTFVCFIIFLTNMTSSVLKRKGKIFDNKESLRKWASEE